MNILTHFDNLNDDLQNYIISKIRYPIHEEICKDIIDFCKFKKEIYKKYEKKGYNYDDTDGIWCIHYQIENDLTQYFNDDIVTMERITDSNIAKLNRILSIKYKISKDKELPYNWYNDKKYYKNCTLRINTLLAILTIEERKIFLQIFPPRLFPWQ